MARSRFVVVALVVLVALGAAQAWAHHSFAATYLETEKVTIEGQLVQFLLRNPGVSVEVVAEKNGKMRLDEDFNFRIFYGHFGARPCPGLR